MAFTLLFKNIVFMIIYQDSQKGKILGFFQAFPHIEVDATFFMKETNFFVGYEASARLSELRKYGFIMNTGKSPKNKRISLYKITEKGKNYLLV